MTARVPGRAAFQKSARERASDKPSWDLERFERQAREEEEDSAAAGTVLRETAKWVISGIAVAAGGVVAGASLSSIGTLLPLGTVPPVWRLAIAAGSGLAGLCGLGALLWSAINVMVGPRPSLDGTVAGRQMRPRTERAVTKAIKDKLRSGADDLMEGDPRLAQAAPKHIDLRAFKQLYEQAAATVANYPDYKRERHERALIALYRRVHSSLILAYRGLLFRRLLLRAFIMTPAGALLLFALAWAANPPKEDYKRLDPYVTTLPTGPSDLPLLERLSGAARCAGDRIRVVIIGEWPSGAQEAVTIPADEGCRPVRLRWDHGQLSTVP